MDYYRRLGRYLATNHPYGRSGKLTPAQRRRLRKKNPEEMEMRSLAYADDPTKKGWA